MSRQFVLWLIGNQSLTEIANRTRLNRRTLIRKFQPFWSIQPQPPKDYSYDNRVLIVDGVYLQSRTVEALIGRTITKPIYWNYCRYESYDSWLDFFSCLKEPSVVVCDGQKGMLLAIRQLWPATKIQRCLVHVQRLVRIRLTGNPKTEAGIVIKHLVDDLFTIRTRRQKRRWVKKYFKWLKRYQEFIDEKSHGVSSITGRKTWWYTHKNLRSVRSLLNNAFPNLFTFAGHYPQIPRTTNHVEGGINPRLKELIRRHRGLSLEQKKILTAVYLSQERKQKPPRFVT